MKITVNGNEQETEDGTTLLLLLEKLSYHPQYVAVAVNWECVPRHRFGETPVREKDAIEILSPQQGG